MAGKPQAETHYLPTLDGWRAIAILIVVLSHDSRYSAGGFSTAWFQANGRAGVDIFFALSGMLICTRLLREESSSGSIHLQKFYVRRFFRIQPPAFAYLAVITALMLADVLDHAFSGVLTSVLVLRNYAPLSFHARDWYTTHFWSLAVEEHFYLLLPGFLLLFRKRRASMLAGFTALLLTWQVVQRRHPSLQFGWAPEDHTDIAVTGILLASLFAVLLQRPGVYAWCQRWLNPYVAIGGNLALLVVRGHGRLALDLLALCAYPLGLASTMLHPFSWPGRLLDSKPLRWLGLISYSVYLWQMLFFTHAAILVPVAQPSLLSSVQHSRWLRYGAVLLCSVLSYFLVEQPLVRLGRRLTAPVNAAEDIAPTSPYGYMTT